MMFLQNILSYYSLLDTTARSYVYAFSHLKYETSRLHSLILERIHHNYFKY